jgi:hypothetical protein
MYLAQPASVVTPHRLNGGKRGIRRLMNLNIYNLNIPSGHLVKKIG